MGKRAEAEHCQQTSRLQWLGGAEILRLSSEAGHPERVAGLLIV
jgi:hypothetical protein